MDVPDTILTMQPIIEHGGMQAVPAFAPVAGVLRDDRALRQRLSASASLPPRAVDENVRAYIPRDIAEDIIRKAQRQAEDVKAWGEQALARMRAGFEATMTATSARFAQEYAVS